MIPQQELTAQDIRETMQSVAQEQLPLSADGYKCTGEMLYDVLMKAASENISIDAACRDLESSASGNRIRELLNEQLDAEKLSEHERQINEALAERLPAQLSSNNRFSVGNKAKSELLCLTFQVADFPFLVTFFVIGSAGILIGLTIFEHIVDDDGDLASGGRDGFGGAMFGL